MNAHVKIGTAMLLDDEVFDQKHYHRILERSGMVENIVGFLYPDEALEYLRQKDRPEIDVLFLDINMPRLNGFEFLEAATKEFGNDFARTVVIMLTTSLDPEDEARARHFSVVKEYFNKPLLREHISRVCELLGEARSQTASEGPGNQ